MIDVITVALAILGLAGIIAIHEAGHFLCAMKFNMPIKAFSIGFGAGLKWKSNGIDYRLGSIPLGGYVSFLSRDEIRERGLPQDTKTFDEYALWKRLIVFAAGPVVNIVFGAVLLFSLLPSEINSLTAVISDVKPDSYAEQHGIQPGDRVLSINGERISNRDEVITNIHLNMIEDELLFVFLSRMSNTEYTIAAPSQLWRQGEGLGIFFVSLKEAESDPTLIYHKDLSITDQMVMTADYGAMIFSSLVKTLIQLPINANARDQLGSVIMLGTEGSKAAKRDWYEYFVFLASVNFMIAFINLLPFPFTDGSQIMLSSIQSLIKKPLPNSVATAYYALGGAAFASIFIIGISNDISRYFFG